MDVTLENSTIKDQIRNLQQTYEASMDKLREKQRQLEVAHVENQLLKMKVTCRSADFLLTPFPFFLSSSFNIPSPFLCFLSWPFLHFSGQFLGAWLEGSKGVSVFTAVSPDWGTP